MKVLDSNITLIVDSNNSLFCVCVCVCVCACVCAPCLLGLLHPGDKLVEVNGQKVQRLQPEHVIQILVSLNLLLCFLYPSPLSLHSRISKTFKPFSYNDCIHSCSSHSFTGEISGKYYF